MRAIDFQILKDTSKRLLANEKARRTTGLYPLDTVILYVTMRCNAKCAHCFCWEDLNIGTREMTLEEIDRVAETVPPFTTLIMTGGEPTLRKDLPEIYAAFASRGKIQCGLINTNGLKPDLVRALVTRIKSEFPDHGLEVQISLDGLQATHDAIRGVPGNFQKAIETMRTVRGLRSQYKALNCHAISIIMDRNYKELVALNDYLREHLGEDVVHGFELVRDVEQTAWLIPEEVREKGVGPKAMNLPPREAFAQIAEDLRTIQRRSPYRASAFHVHNLAQLRMVESGKPAYPCVTAGQSVAVVYTNGDVAHCEFTLPFANLAETGFHFEQLWLGEKANARRAQIKQCYCIHGCFHGKAVEYSWRGIAAMAKEAL